MPQQKTIIIGAAGAVGKQLSRALKNAGSTVIAADRMKHLPGSVKEVASIVVGGVDVRDPAAVNALLREHGCENTTVWNLAAPLSVETALSPEVAESVVIGGMKNTLAAMELVGCRRICFTDSIGSFGASSPRTGAKASWLVANPTQDPGSDYGLQKRACRELLNDFRLRGGDPRFAVLPGVLHTQPVWGNGTTEYALDAILAAAFNKHFVCPIDPDVTMPMVFVDDLMRGLVALQFSEEAELKEPERGYTIPGLSFSANQLFHEIRQHNPDFTTSVEINENMDKFARLWPDKLSDEEAKRDLEYEPVVSMPLMVAAVLNGHASRRLNSKAAFRTIDTDESGNICVEELTRYVRKHLVRGREKAEYLLRRQDLVDPFVAVAFAEMDTDKDGLVCLNEFMQWSWNNDVESKLDDFISEHLISESETK
jgi:nucleoside-diphosphate-sugar epimerase